MQNNTDSMNKTKEIPEVHAKQGTNEAVRDDVHEDQQSLFDTEDVFSESMLVEKDTVEINSSESETSDTYDGGDTAVFTFPEKKAEEDVSVKELQDSAKDYFEATHSDSIEEKVNELCKLADRGFDEEDDEEEFSVEKESIVIDEKKKKKDRKLRRRGVILDDDIEMLAGGIVTTAASTMMAEKETDDVKTWESSKEAEETVEEPVFAKEQGVEHKNPLGLYDDDDESEEKTEEDELIEALGGSKKHFKTFEAVFGDDEPEVEYTDRNQEPSILGDLRKNAIISAISVVFTLILTAVCFYFEFAAGTKLAHPAFFEAGKFGVTYSMCMLQIMFLCVIFNLDGIRRAFRGLRPAKPSAEGFCAAAVVVCTLHSIISAILVSDSPDLKSFCSVGCLSLLFLSINSFIKAHTSLTSFCFAASKAQKLSSVDLDLASGEAKAFEKYLDKDTALFKVGKSDFVNGFFKKCMTVPKASKNTFKLVVLVFAVAVVTGVVCGLLGKDVYSGVCAFTTVCLAALPVNALISTALPFFAVSSRVKKTQTAFIGEAACDAYESVGVVSFDDTEVFPAKSVKVSSIRTYGDNRIDKVILYMARIFDKVEGPLSFVFSNSVQTLENRDMDVQISEQFSDGISAKIDGREVLVGTDNFMRLYDIETPLDNIDESFTRSLGSIMYMSVDGLLAAKFYIKYTMSRSFEPILRSFYDAGICVGIRTSDPCITNEILCGNLKGSNYPVSVIRKHNEKEVAGDTKSTEGAIISLSGVHNFLKGFIKLDNLRNVYRSNTIISIFSVVAGVVLSAFMNVTGFFEIGIVILSIFQLVWCIPTILFSLLSK